MPSMALGGLWRLELGMPPLPNERNTLRYLELDRVGWGLMLHPLLRSLSFHFVVFLSDSVGNFGGAYLRAIHREFELTF